MREYLKHLAMPLQSVHPTLASDADGQVMDLVEVPLSELGYRVVTLEVLGKGRLSARGHADLNELVRKSRVVYGDGYGAAAAAGRHQVPNVVVREYNLNTSLVFAGAGVSNPVVRTVRKARALRHYLSDVVPAIRRAVGLHCNGYPAYAEAPWLNRNRLLYLDSRMRTEMVISEEALEARLRDRGSRRPRLLFSGRFEAAKGAHDVVLAAAACHRRGWDFELSLYGQGSERAAIDRSIAAHGLSGKVTVFDPVPFPTLMERAKAFDLFICCHIQDDPSCTYLESFGCGLPILGYGNAMWKAMRDDSDVGCVTELGSPERLAQAILSFWAGHGDELPRWSRRARAFALDHSFEREFSRRTEALTETYQTAAPKIR
jgi:colanic acid/amylovoran biosynthesis glycosyltransferase